MPKERLNYYKTFMPVAIDVYNKKVVLIGGGRVAWHKIESLEKYCNNIYVVAIEVSEKIKESGISYIEKKYEASDLDGALLVYACTNIRELNQQVKRDAEVRNILANTVDKPEECDFVSPAIYRFENISIAVSSNGENVFKSIEERNKIKHWYENEKTNNVFIKAIAAFKFFKKKSGR